MLSDLPKRLGQAALGVAFVDVYASRNAHARGLLFISVTGSTARIVTVVLSESGASDNGVAETIYVKSISGGTTTVVDGIHMGPDTDLRVKVDAVPTNDVDASIAFLGVDTPITTYG